MDPYIWLEDVLGDESIAFVQKENQIAVTTITANEQFSPLESRILAILDDKQKIPYVSKIGNLYYNFWKDVSHTYSLSYRQDTVINIHTLTTPL